MLRQVFSLIISIVLFFCSFFAYFGPLAVYSRTSTTLGGGQGQPDKDNTRDRNSDFDRALRSIWIKRRISDLVGQFARPSRISEVRFWISENLPQGKSFIFEAGIRTAGRLVARPVGRSRCVAQAAALSRPARSLKRSERREGKRRRRPNSTTQTRTMRASLGRRPKKEELDQLSTSKRSHSSVGKSVQLISIRSMVRARVGPLFLVEHCVGQRREMSEFETRLRAQQSYIGAAVLARPRGAGWFAGGIGLAAKHM